MCLWRILCGVRDSKVKVEGRKVKVGGRKEQCDFASRGAKKLIFQLVKHFVFIKVFLASRAHKALRARRYVSGLSIRSALRTPAGALGLPPSGRHPCTSFRFALEENSEKRLLLLEFSFLLLFSLLVC